ncbi:hypothetical protein EFU35_07160 [Vibrio cholerae]|nr:hypothetical protein [Vibrio cholerae]
MKIGKTWAVFECDDVDDSRKLLSLMPPRLPSKYVHFFVEQTYVDRYGDLNEKLAHKKCNSVNLKAQANGSVVILKLPGEDKYIIAYRCMNSEILGNTFRFTFRKFIHRENGLHKTAESDYLEAEVGEVYEQ